jgi:hypothetical protein
MAIAINGAGTITGITAGGLPDGVIQGADLASGVGGKVLQVVNTTITAASAFTGTPHTSAFSAMYELITCSITPTVTGSKILCFYNIGLGGDFGQTLHIGEGTTEFAQGDASSNRSRGIYSGHVRVVGEPEVSPISGQILHSVTTTAGSARTYRIKVTNNGTTASYFNRSAVHRNDALGYDGVVSSHFTLMEIGA